MNKNIFDVIVIGGGPAGLIAAGTAAKKGLTVLLLEKKHKLGLKLGLTGKGRCNLTNMKNISEVIKQFGKNGRFLIDAFNQFFNQDLIDFFNQIKIKTVLERGDRVFLQGIRAPQAALTLSNWAEKNKVKIITDCFVKQVICNPEKQIKKVIDNKNQLYFSENIIVSTGGKSYPVTGSTGDGYLIAKKLGHNIVPPIPALTPLLYDDSCLNILDGLTLKNVSISLIINNKVKEKMFGEIEFIDNTISGAIPYTLSKTIIKELKKENSVELSIDLKPALEHNKLDMRLLREINNKENKNISDFLSKLMPFKLQTFCIKKGIVELNLNIRNYNKNDRKKLRLWLKDFKIKITSHASFKRAIITSGGVSLKEVNPKTMESKIIKGLYFCGEVLDIDGSTGGYNLQAAFSTGYTAGININKKS